MLESRMQKYGKFCSGNSSQVKLSAKSHKKEKKKAQNRIHAMNIAPIASESSSQLTKCFE